MKPQELRIGNLVQNLNGFQMQIVGIFEDEILLDFEGNEGGVWQFSKKELELLQGIPLNEEWFFKLGFRKESDNYFILNVLNRGRINAYIKEDKVSIELGNRASSSFGYPNISNVHQLQNLYYDLTNEELTLKLNKTMKEKLLETLDRNKEDDGYVEFMLEKMNAEEFFNNEFDVDVEKVHRKHVIDLMINFARYYHKQQEELSKTNRNYERRNNKNTRP